MENSKPDRVDLAELARYLRVYQENPDSRVFAPLADLYRRLGRFDDAMEVVRDGLRRHPYYSSARVVYAHLLIDLGKFPEAERELESVVTYYPENLLARKLLVKSKWALGRRDQALREWEALKAISPELGSDPELERLMVEPSPTDPLESARKSSQIASQKRNKIKSLKKKQLFLESALKRLEALRF